MPEITIDDDDFTFFKCYGDKGKVYVDGFELSAALMQRLGNSDTREPTNEDYVSSMRKVCWSDGDLSLISDEQIQGLALRVMTRMNELGKERGSRQTSAPRMAS